MQGCVDGLGERKQPLALPFGLDSLSRVEDDAVILIGAQGLLQATLAAQCDPAEIDVAEVGASQSEFNQAFSQPIIQRRNDTRQLMGRDPWPSMLCASW